MRYRYPITRCLPRVTEEFIDSSLLLQSPKKNLQYKKVLNYRKTTFRILICCLAAAMICNQGIYIGSYRFEKGFEIADDALDYMEDVFTDMMTEGYGLESAGQTIASYIAEATPSCPEVSNTIPFLSAYQSAIDEYLDYVEPLAHRCKKFEDYLYRVARKMRSRVVWLVYGIAWAAAAILAMAHCTRSKAALKFSAAVSGGFIVAMIGVLGVELFVMMLVADFCMDPTDNALGLVETAYFNMTKYYATCEGTNPIAEPLGEALVSLEVINVTVTSLSSEGAPCENNPYLAACSQSIGYAVGNLTELSSSAQCLPVQEQWEDLFDDAICTEGFHGTYYIWVAQLCTLVVLFAAIVVASIAYQYYGSKWQTGEGDHLDSESDDEFFSKQAINPNRSNSRYNSRLVDEPGFLFINDDRESFVITEDEELSEPLVHQYSVDAESDDTQEDQKRYRFGSKSAAVEHMPYSEGSKFSRYLI